MMRISVGPTRRKKTEFPSPLHPASAPLPVPSAPAPIPVPAPVPAPVPVPGPGLALVPAPGLPLLMSEIFDGQLQAPIRTAVFSTNAKSLPPLSTTSAVVPTPAPTAHPAHPVPSPAPPVLPSPLPTFQSTADDRGSFGCGMDCCGGNHGICVVDFILTLL